MQLDAHQKAEFEQHWNGSLMHVVHENKDRLVMCGRFQSPGLTVAVYPVSANGRTDLGTFVANVDQLEPFFPENGYYQKPNYELTHLTRFTVRHTRRGLSEINASTRHVCINASGVVQSLNNGFDYALMYRIFNNNEIKVKNPLSHLKDLENSGGSGIALSRRLAILPHAGRGMRTTKFVLVYDTAPIGYVDSDRIYLHRSREVFMEPVKELGIAPIELYGNS